MNIVLNVETDKYLNENYIIVYKNGGWKAISKELFLNDVYSQYANLTEKIERLEKNLGDLAKIVKEL